MIYKNYIKSFLDFVVSLVAFIILLPLFLMIWVCLIFANGGNAFFFQLRPGKNEKIFRVIKFKTMNDKKDVKGNLLPDAERLTPIGKFIRKTSLDELPQLLNVIEGNMSLIGPRPLLIKYLPYYSAEERIRFSVKPGITGWAQVNGRNNLEWNERLALDSYYVRHVSASLDMRIFFNTIRNIITSKDILIDPRSAMLDLDVERKDKPNA